MIDLDFFKCSKCKELKERHFFSKCSRSKNNVKSQCKACVKNFYVNNAARIKLKTKNYYYANIENVKITQKKYCIANRAKLKKYYRNYRGRNAAKLKENYKNYKVRNAAKMKIYHKEYMKKKCRMDVKFKISNLLRSRIFMALKCRSLVKQQRSIQLLGCSIEQYKQHLEKSFEPGMSWKNHGEWHIDHIKPLASFDLQDEEQQKLAFNFKNTQALWKADNLAKGSKLDWEPKKQ